MAIGIKKKKPLNPIIEPFSSSIIAECVAFSFSIVDAVTESNVVAESITTSSSSSVSSSSSSVIGEAYLAPVWSNQSSSSSSVICEAIANNLLAAVMGINIYDEGILVKENTSCLDFKGADVLAIDGTGGCVQIWVPPAAYVSHFNTSDGVTNGVVSNISTSSRYISSPSSEGTPFYTGGWNDLAAHPCTRTGILTWSPAQDISLVSNSTTFTIALSGPQGVIETYTTGSITGDGVYSSSNIELTVSSWAADSNKFRAGISIQVNLDATLSSNSGRFALTIQHNNGADGNFNYTQPNVFYDTQLYTFSINTLLSTLNTPVTKQISGVYYMKEATTFDFEISDIDYSNSDSYPTTLITTSISNFGITPNPNIISSDLTGWTNDYNNINNSWSDTLAINNTNYRVCGSSAQFTATPQDWVAGSTQTAAAMQVLIDTYTDDSTNGANSITENFTSESLRVSSAGVSWNSSSVLASGDLLIHCSKAKTQQIDFTAYLPHNGTSIINPDYSSSGGATQTYYRFYTTNGLTRSGGVFTFTGVVEGDLGSDILIDISLDGTNWYDCTSNYLGGALVDGAGCRVPGEVMPNLELTLGTFTTNDASGIVPADSIMLRITMPSASAVELDTANFTWNI